ncbi:protein of unknown function [Streptomyces murinus]
MMHITVVGVLSQAGSHLDCRAVCLQSSQVGRLSVQGGVSGTLRSRVAGSVTHGKPLFAFASFAFFPYACASATGVAGAGVGRR